MRTTLILLTFLYSFNLYSKEITPVDSQGRVFGLETGIYRGESELTSNCYLIPNGKFESRRTIGKGIIIAHTKAKFGPLKPSIKAILKVIDTGSGKFKLQLLDNKTLRPQKIVGQGECSQDLCSFTAKLNKGTLKLEEAWRIDGHSFEIIRGNQKVLGIEHEYRGDFLLLE